MGNVSYACFDMRREYMSSRKRRRYCEHCNDNVSIRTYKRHKADFFDTETKQWKEKPCEDSHLEDDKIITGKHGHRNCEATIK